MDKEPMTDAQLRRRRKVQGQIGRTTSTLGLAGAGLGVGGLVVAKKPGALKALREIPKVGHKLGKTPEEAAGKLKNAALYTGIASGGIGGVGGFNAASIYSDEARRKKQTTLKKGLTMEPQMDMGYYGEEGRPLTHQQIEAEIEKAWTPSASNFDSEAKRKKRSDVYAGGALVTGGAGAAYGAHHGAKSIGHARKIKTEHMAPVTAVPAVAERAAVAPVKGVPADPGQTGISAAEAKEQGVKPQRARKATAAVEEVKEVKFRAGRKPRLSASTKEATSAIRTAHLKPALTHGGKAALGAAVAGGAVAAGAHIKRKKKESWQAYEKRDTASAFGVDHRMDSQ